MDLIKRRIDKFAEGVRADIEWNADGRFDSMSDHDIKNYFTSTQDMSNTQWIEAPRKPSAAETFGEGWTQFAKKLPSVLTGTKNSLKDLARVNPNDLQAAYNYKNSLDQKDKAKNRNDYRTGRVPYSHFNREGREDISLMSVNNVDGVNEIDQSYQLALAQDNEGRKIDAENYRKTLQSAQKSIQEDESLQAHLKWWEENPVEGFTGWFNDPTNFVKGFTDFSTSFVPIVLGSLAGGALGGPGGAVAAGAAVGYNLEAGNHFETAFKIAKEDLNLNDEEAFMVASENARIYGAASGFLEALVPAMKVKRGILPDFLKKGFMGKVMKSAHESMEFGGKSINKEGYSKILTANYGNVMQKFTKHKTNLINSEAFSGKVKNLLIGGSDVGFELTKNVSKSLAKYIRNRFTTAQGKEALAEVVTEVSQYITEEAMTDGKLMGEELDADWLNKKVNSQGFKDSAALALFSIFIGGGGSNLQTEEGGKVTTKNNIDKSDARRVNLSFGDEGYFAQVDGEDIELTVPEMEALLLQGKDKGVIESVKQSILSRITGKPQKAEETVVTPSGQTINFDGNPIENGRWTVLTEEEVNESNEEADIPVLTRVESSINDLLAPIPSERPKVNDKNQPITNLGEEILSNVLGNKWEGLKALESAYVLSEEQRDNAMQQIGVALTKADDAGILNLTIDKDGRYNADEVRHTLRGLISNDFQLSVKQEDIGKGQAQKTTVLEGNVDESRMNEVIEQLQNPIQSFANLNIESLIEAQSNQELPQPGNNIGETNSSLPPEALPGDPGFMNTNNLSEEQRAEDLDKPNLSVSDRIRSIFLDTSMDKAKEDVASLNPTDFKSMVSELGYDNLAGLKKNKDGSISSSKKNKKLVFEKLEQDLISDQKQVENATFVNESKQSMQEDHVEDKAPEETLNHTVTNNINDSNGVLNGMQGNDFNEEGKNGGGIYDDTNHKFSEIELEGDDWKSWQPLSYQGGEATPLAQKIVDRLKKSFPWIEGRALDRVFSQDGVEKAGKAFKNIAEWSKDKSRIDDMPHEYFHNYLDMFESAPIMQQALKKFTNYSPNNTEAQNREAKEELTEIIGNYYAGRIQDNALSKRIKIWVRQAWLKFKKMFNKLSKEEFAEIVGENFFQGKVPVKTDFRGLLRKGYGKVVWYSEVNLQESEDNQVNDDGHPEEINKINNLKDDASYLMENVFFKAFGTYLPKRYIASDIPEMIENAESYESFKESFMDDVIEKFEPQFADLADVEEQVHTFYLQNKSKTRLSVMRADKKDEDGNVITDDDNNPIQEIIPIDIENGRIRYEMIFSSRFGKQRFEGFRVQHENNHVRRGVKNATSFIQNFMELQAKTLGDGNKFMYMPLKSVYKIIQTEDYPDGFPVQDSNDMGLTTQWVKNMDKEFASRFVNGDTPYLPFFFTTKAGDNQQMILSAVPNSWKGSQQSEFNNKSIDVTKITKEFFENEIDAQVSAGFMTQAQGDVMKADALEMSKEFLNGIDKKTNKLKGKSPKGLKVKAITTKKQRGKYSSHNDLVAAYFDRKTKTIFIDKAALKRKFKSKAWTKPMVKGMEALPEDAFNTYQEFESFVIQHETAHYTQPSKQKGETKAQYESRLNDVAFEVIETLKDESMDLSDPEALSNAREAERGIPRLGNVAYAQTLGWHIRLQQVKGSNILMRNSDVVDVVNRMRGDFSEGITPYESGDRNMMWFNTNDIEIRSPGEDGSLTLWDRSNPLTKEDDGDDGSLWTGTRHLNSMGSSFGTQKDWYELKTVIRQLDNSNENVHTYNDYIQIKALETNPPAGTKIYRKGEVEPFIEVRGEGTGTYFYVLSGAQQGMEFDTFGTNNEVKDVSGKYAKQGEIFTLPETSTKVLMKSEVPQTAAHPVSAHEIALDESLLEFEEGVEYTRALENYITSYVNKSMNQLLTFRDDPKALRDYLYKSLRVGELPTQMQKWVELWEDGEGMALPEFIDQVVPYLNNQIITGGMLQLRTDVGRGSKLYIKPIRNLRIENRSYIASSGNTTALNMVKQDYLEDKGIKLEEAGFLNKHDMIKKLNVWLGERNYLTLLHRQPIQGATKVEPRRLQQFIEGEGNALHMRPEDTFTKHEADNDGDVIYIERPKDLSLINAMENLSKTDYWAKRDRVVALKMFLGDDRNLSIASREDRGQFYADNGNAMGSQGRTVNAKSVAAVMSYKNLEFSDITLPKGVKYQVRKPDEKVIMDYIGLDYNTLFNEGMLDLIEQNGDKVLAKVPVGKDGNLEWQEVPKENILAALGRNKKGKLVKPEMARTLHLQTTFENEMSNLLQMSVDNVKLGLLSKINFDSNFVMKRVFKRSDNLEISERVTGALQDVFNTFKYSATRRGKDKKQNSLEMGEMMIEFSDLRNRYIDADGDFLDQSSVSSAVTTEILSQGNRPRKVKVGKELFNWTPKNLTLKVENLSPMERMLITPDLFMSELDGVTKNDISGNLLESHKRVHRYSHVMAMKEMKEQMGNKLVDVQKNPKTMNEAREALNFAEEIAQEFYSIFEKIKEQRGEHAKAIKSIKYEYSSDFVDFIDKFQPKFDALSNLQKEIATYKFLSGSAHKNLKNKSTKIAFASKLLPIDMMEPNVLKNYGKLYSEFKKDENKTIEGKEVKPSNARYGLFLSTEKFDEILKKNKCV